MKLLVIISDPMNALDMLHATGVMPMLNKRAIEIELTQEQIDKINLSKKSKEEIESITLINQPN